MRTLLNCLQYYGQRPQVAVHRNCHLFCIYCTMLTTVTLTKSIRLQHISYYSISRVARGCNTLPMLIRSIGTLAKVMKISTAQVLDRKMCRVPEKQPRPFTLVSCLALYWSVSYSRSLMAYVHRQVSSLTLTVTNIQSNKLTRCMVFVDKMLNTRISTNCRECARYSVCCRKFYC